MSNETKKPEVLQNDNTLKTVTIPETSGAYEDVLKVIETNGFPSENPSVYEIIEPWLPHIPPTSDKTKLILPEPDLEIEIPPGNITKSKAITETYPPSYIARLGAIEDLVLLYNQSSNPKIKYRIQLLLEDHRSLEKFAEQFHKVEEDNNQVSRGPIRTYRAKPNVLSATAAQQTALGKPRPNFRVKQAETGKVTDPEAITDNKSFGLIEKHHESITFNPPEKQEISVPTRRPYVGDATNPLIFAEDPDDPRTKSIHLGIRGDEFETLKLLSQEELAYSLFVMEHMHIGTVELERWSPQDKKPFFQAYGFIENLPADINPSLTPRSIDEAGEGHKKRDFIRRLAKTIQTLVEHNETLERSNNQLTTRLLLTNKPTLWRRFHTFISGIFKRKDL